jgi:hypothetical protein
VDACITIVASDEYEFTGDQLRRALLRWPAVTELTLFGLTDEANDAAVDMLRPLSTSTVTGLTILVIREVGHAALVQHFPQRGSRHAPCAVRPHAECAMQAWAMRSRPVRISMRAQRMHAPCKPCPALHAPISLLALQRM